ncbi:MAG: 4-oxalocrotonate tautomerase [Thermoplasmata archaeon HGW-Thermoplasmata-1]|nr:MAG: 4-oxalocrotonate tautomerase [Thermoplasmata archaeon HGW-Thermoplasmata-1]
MPSIHVYMWAGKSREMKKKMIEGFTKVCVDLGVPADYVEVILHDVPKENWGIAGVPASEME